MALLKENFISYDDYLKLKEHSENKTKPSDKATDNSLFPSIKHQLVSSNLHVEIGMYLKGTSLKVFAAPTEIQLSSSNIEEVKIVIPDLFVISNNQITNSKYIGVPSLVIEILDSSNQTYDLVTKFDLYMKYGVQEYWIVNPLKHAITVYVLNTNGLYEQTDIKVEQGFINSTVLKTSQINLKDIFSC